jgi:hypothetical protein
VRRLAHAVIIVLLMLTASGAQSLVSAEPCGAFEQFGADDGACPPLCVTCGCCAQTVEPMVLPSTVAPDSSIADLVPVIPSAPKTDPGDILHVPKPRLA